VKSINYTNCTALNVQIYIYCNLSYVNELDNKLQEVHKKNPSPLLKRISRVARRHLFLSTYFSGAANLRPESGGVFVLEHANITPKAGKIVCKTVSPACLSRWRS
jgi:hypothetical protein